MLRATDCLVVAHDPYLSVDLTFSLEEMFNDIRVVAISSVAEAREMLPCLPHIGLAVFDAALNRAERTALAADLSAQGAMIAVVGSLQSANPPEVEDGIRRFFFNDELLAWLATLVQPSQS